MNSRSLIKIIRFINKILDHSKTFLDENLAVLNIERDVVYSINNEDILEVYCTKNRKFVLKLNLNFEFNM